MLLLTDSDIAIVGEAAYGKEVLKIARQQQPDLILMKLTFPDISGNAIIEALRQQQLSVPMRLFTVLQAMQLGFIEPEAAL